LFILTTTKMSSGKRHKDIKSRTKNRFITLDTDIDSQYDEIERERSPAVRKDTFGRQLESIQRDIGGHSDRVNRQTMRGASGKRDMVFEVIMKSEAKSDIRLMIQSLYDLDKKVLPFNITENMKRSRIRFFVCTVDAAESLKLLNRRLSHPINPRDKFMIQYTQQPSPWDILDLKMKMAIKDVVLSRYIPSTNSIDLSSFQSNKIFADRDLHTLCSLSRTAILVEVILVVAERFSDITGLSLMNNRLTSLSYVQSLTFACKNIVELDLSENLLKDVEELHRIRHWGIQRLSLVNNPLTSEYSNLTSYVAAIQTYLPRVSYLDGVVVDVNPLKIEADLQQRIGILFPSAKPSYFPDSGVKQRVEQLLVQYYDLYDGKPSDKSRQSLVNAYDENATFTFATGLLSAEPKKSKHGDEAAFQQYARSSHNVCIEKKWERHRGQLIFKGSMAIAVALSQLPQTVHEKSLFSLEFVTVRQQLLIFTLQGVFRDGKDVQNPSGALKFFNRAFTVVARGEEKLAIVNDALIITAINREEFDSYNERLKKAPETQAEFHPVLNVVAKQILPSEEVQQLYDRNDPEIQQEMVEAFSQQSGMKLEWARKCLEDTQWDFEAAGNVFNAMKEQIPSEAFI